MFYKNLFSLSPSISAHRPGFTSAANRTLFRRAIGDSGRPPSLIASTPTPAAAAAASISLTVRR
jgi:hypothetical protein